MDTSNHHLLRSFPNLQLEQWALTSEATPTYNCIAWAGSDTQSWWWPDPWGIYKWPIDWREESIGCFIEAFQCIGFERCEHGDLEEGFEKVALYQIDNLPKHMARQQPDGFWTSKCGQAEDIAHTLRGLEGSQYGVAGYFLKRSL